jgi:molybdate transport system substrate-binding protein
MLNPVLNRVLLSIVLAFALVGSLTAAAQTAAPPTIAAASDLQFALEEIAAKFRAETGRQVRLSFGSSGNYYRQIEQGAPFELFMSADEAFVFKLAAAGRTEDRGVLYAIGRIVLFAPHGSSLELDAGMSGLRKALAGGGIRRFAIANPEHAPYGRAAEEALKKTGLWDSLRPRLVMGENVSQAAQFAASGSADGGIFAYSLALAPAVAKRGSYVLLPDTLHAPLAQRMVLVKGAGATAREFYRYVQKPAAQAVLKRYGFVVPGGS